MGGSLFVLGCLSVAAAAALLLLLRAVSAAVMVTSGILLVPVPLESKINNV